MRYLFLLLLILTGCTSGPQEVIGFSTIECSMTEMPQFDVRKVSLLDTNGVAYKDTIISQIEKRRTVFKQLAKTFTETSSIIEQAGKRNFEAIIN